MISVETLYNDLGKLLRKTRGGGFIDDDTFNLHLQATEKWLLQMLHAAYEDTQSISDHLEPFVIYLKYQSTDTNGILAYPSDYAHRLAVTGLYVENPSGGSSTVTAKTYECPMLRTAEVDTILSDPLAYPDFGKRRFYHTYRNAGIQVFPERKMWMSLTYLRYPVYGSIKHDESTVDGQDLFTYNSSESRDLEWNDITYPHILYKMGEQLGISTKDMEYLQMNQLNKIG